MNRLLIYYLRDRCGTIGKHVKQVLEDLNRYCEKTILICTKFPKVKECEQIPADKVLRQRKIQHSFYAFIEGVHDIGWEELLKYDEVLFVTDEVFGPLSETCTWMQDISEEYIDFWGLVEGFLGDQADRRYIPIEFFAIRKNVVCSGAFQSWVEKTYTEGVAENVQDKCDSLLSDFLIGLGFEYKSWCQLQGVDRLYNNPLIQIPDRLVKTYNLPFFSMRAFSTEYRDVVKYCDGKGARNLYNYLVEIGYNLNNLWDVLCRNVNQADWYNTLHLNYIVSDRKIDRPSRREKIALMMHLYYMDILDLSYSYASNMPEDCDVYITTDCDIKRKMIEKKFGDLKCNRLRVIVVENRGRSESAFLVGLRPYMYDYDYICFFHDKKTNQTTPGAIGNDFWYKCINNIMLSKDYVNNLIDLFVKNERLGLLMSRPPVHSYYYPTHGVYGWGDNFDNVRALLEELQVDTLLDADKEPLAPLGSMFWFRPQALSKLLDKEWVYEDFPEEPNPQDGTLLHAIERIYSFVAQSRGYFSAYVSTEDSATEELSALAYYMSEVNKILYMKGYFNDLESAVNLLDSLAREENTL